jgi:predicted metal-dependent HD superfamily phosphohydrolase
MVSKLLAQGGLERRPLTLVLDLELHRLAVDYDDFQRHTADVKREYATIIDGREDAWQSVRSAVYASFQSREKIFYTAAMRRFEGPC